MSWKFWKKGAREGVQEEKLPRPKNVPDVVGRSLIVNKGKDPDWVWNLRAVVKPRPGEKSSFDFRLFSDSAAAAKGVRVKNYHSLDHHPELILFEGWYDKKANKAEITEREKTGDVGKAA